MQISCKYVLAYIAVIFLGWLLVGLVLKLMRLSIRHEYRVADTTKPAKSSWRIVDLWLGGIERTIAVTLIIYAPPLLAPFIGGWTALKFASNWGRTDRKSNDAGSSFVFLVGSALSFGLAIWVGLLLNPEAIDVWATKDQ